MIRIFFGLLTLANALNGNYERAVIWLAIGMVSSGLFHTLAYAFGSRK